MRATSALDYQPSLPACQMPLASAARSRFVVTSIDARADSAQPHHGHAGPQLSQRRHDEHAIVVRRHDELDRSLR